MKVEVKTLDAKKSGDVELNDAIFGIEPRADILHRVVTGSLKSAVHPLPPPVSAAMSPAPARSSAVRKAAVWPVTAIAVLRSLSVVVRPMVSAPALSVTTSTRRFVRSA